MHSFLFTSKSDAPQTSNPISVLSCMVLSTYLAATYNLQFTCICIYIYIYMIVWIYVAVVEEGISPKYKINVIYFIVTSEFTLMILISYF